MNNGWEKFHKYVGVQGILALVLTFSLIAWISVGIVIPDLVHILLGASWGFYFAKNGGNVVSGAKSFIAKDG